MKTQTTPKQMKNILLIALASMMLMTTACSNGKKSDEPSDGGGGGGGANTSCINCDGFVNGPTVFQGNLTGTNGSISNLQVIADQNSLDAIAPNYSSPRLQGSYQGLVTAGTLTVSGNACIADGTYQMSAFQAGMISPSLNTQAASSMWVTLNGPSVIRAPIYVRLADSNGDDVADNGTQVYIWLNCNSTWTALSLIAN